MRAAEWEAKCLVIGGGNLQRGAWRLTLMERRAALAIESAKPARVAGRGRSQRPQGGTAPNGAASPMRDSAASGPSGRTLRRREGRRKRRERETTAASDKASGQTEAATPAANADGAERGAVGMEVAEQAATPRTVPAKASEPSRGAVGDSGRSRSADRNQDGQWLCYCLPYRSGRRRCRCRRSGERSAGEDGEVAAAISRRILYNPTAHLDRRRSVRPERLDSTWYQGPGPCSRLQATCQQACE